MRDRRRRRAPRDAVRDNPDHMRPLVNKKNMLANKEFWACYSGPITRFGVRVTHHNNVWNGYEWVYISFDCVENSLDATSSTSKKKCRPRRH